MPAGDGTGPTGMGPMTGRGMGYCAGYSVPGYMNPAPGMGAGFRRGFGRGRGFGFGRGFGRRFAYGVQAPVNTVNNNVPSAVPYYRGPNYNGSTGPEQEMNYLENTARAMEEELSAIKERIEQLKENQE